MGIDVTLYVDAAEFLAVAGKFLILRPVLHNTILTILNDRVVLPELGHYWVATRDGQVAGVVIQSPLTRSAQVVPMEIDVVRALADAIEENGDILPGVIGDAATAAVFAGRWTEVHQSAATPIHGYRIYELDQLKAIGAVEGSLRRAEASDRTLVESWVREFEDETNAPPIHAVRLLMAGRIWLWQNGKAVSMAVARTPVEGVVRITTVFTPPGERGHGYATACSHGVSKHYAEEGLRCILNTDLENAVSNAMYRKLGYVAFAELLIYRFDQSLTEPSLRISELLARIWRRVVREWRARRRRGRHRAAHRQA